MSDSDKYKEFDSHTLLIHVALNQDAMLVRFDKMNDTVTKVIERSIRNEQDIKNIKPKLKLLESRQWSMTKQIGIMLAAASTGGGISGAIIKLIGG